MSMLGLVTMVLVGTSAHAEPHEGPQVGWMVIVAGDADAREAATKLRRYQKDGPSVGAYPQQVDSGTVQGLNPGFHIVVAGVPRDKAVAQQMAAALGRTWEGAYIREVVVDGVEDVGCDTDPRCVRGLQILGHAAGTHGGGDPYIGDEDRKGPTSAWKRSDPQVPLPGSPVLYDVYAGGGEGDCPVQMLEFQVDGKPASRLFFDASCFGDTSSMTTTPVALKGDSFALRTVVDGMRDPTMQEDGTFAGEAFHEETDRVYRWHDGTLTEKAE